MIDVVYRGVFEPDLLEWSGWLLQLALIAWLLARRPRSAPLPPLSLPVCALILAAGWIWRLAYGFALEADDFGYWIGDDPFRFVRAWEWSRAPVAAFPNDPWIAGSYYLHGSAMALLGGDAIHASKLVSACYPVLPLVGVFLFTQAVFERREVAALASILVTPAWIQVLLETGLMTELPVTGLLLSGAALLLFGLREPPGRRRHALHVAAAASLAAATAFHLVAWLYLSVLQLAFLTARIAGRRPARLAEWALVTGGSGAFCAFWLLTQWQMTGSPFAQLGFAAIDAPYKLGGAPLESAGIYPVSLYFSLRPLLPLVLLGVALPFAPRRPALPRWVLAGLAVALLLLVGSAISSGTNLTPFRSVVPLATALVAFAAAALFPHAPGGQNRLWPRPVLGFAALALALTFADGHAEVLEHRIVGSAIWTAREPRPARGSLFALGRWLRREVPRRSADPDHVVPARIDALAAYPIVWSLLAHATGEPAWLERTPRGGIEADLRPGQLVVTRRELSQTDLNPVAIIGPYFVYEAPRDGPERGGS